MNETPETVVNETPETAVNEIPQEVSNEAVEKEAPEVAAEAVPAPAPKAKKVKKPWPVPVRILMGFIAFILCVVMFAVSVAGVLILNVRTVVSRDGITKIVNQLVTGAPASGPVRPALAVGAGVYLDEHSSESDVTGSLVDWAYGILKDQLGEEMTVTREQVQTFVQESTVKDFVIDKAAGLVEDFYSGDNKTTITVEEVLQMMEENKQILEEQFGVVINQEAKDAVSAMLAENEILEPLKADGLMGYIEKTMDASQKPGFDGNDGSITDGSAMENVLGAGSEVGSVRWTMNLVRTATSYEAVAVLAGAFVLLMLLLFTVNRFSFPVTLADTGVVLLLTGLLYGLPTAVCLYAPEMVAAMLGGQTAGILKLIFGAAAVVNFTVLGLGFALIVAAIVVKIVLSVKAKKA